MKLTRGQLAVIASLLAVGSVLGVVLAKQEWSLEATAVIASGVVSGLTFIGALLVMLLDPDGRPAAVRISAPSNTR